MTITLYTADGLSETFDNSHEDLTTKGHFVKADVSAGTWILYTYADYNNAQNGGSPSNYKVLKAGDTDETIATVNGSLYLVAKATEGYILFDHVYYGGKRKVRVARVKPRLNRKTSPRYVSSAGICFSVTVTVC